MKLDEFVKQTLTDIAKGVADAQEESLFYIAPGYVNGERQEQGQIVKFEVAVTVNSEGAGGVSILALGKVEGSHARESASRISFDVPVFFNAPTVLNKRHGSREGPLGPKAGENK